MNKLTPLILVFLIASCGGGDKDESKDNDKPYSRVTKVYSGYVVVEDMSGERSNDLKDAALNELVNYGSKFIDADSLNSYFDRHYMTEKNYTSEGDLEHLYINELIDTSTEFTYEYSYQAGQLSSVVKTQQYDNEFNEIGYAELEEQQWQNDLLMNAINIVRPGKDFRYEYSDDGLIHTAYIVFNGSERIYGRSVYLTNGNLDYEEIYDSGDIHDIDYKYENSYLSYDGENDKLDTVKIYFGSNLSSVTQYGYDRHGRLSFKKQTRTDSLTGVVHLQSADYYIYKTEMKAVIHLQMVGHWVNDDASLYRHIYLYEGADTCGEYHRLTQQYQDYNLTPNGRVSVFINRYHDVPDCKVANDFPATDTSPSIF